MSGLERERLNVRSSWEKSHMVIKLQDQVWRGQLLVGTKSVYVGGGGDGNFYMLISMKHIKKILYYLTYSSGQ